MQCRLRTKCLYYWQLKIPTTVILYSGFLHYIQEDAYRLRKYLPRIILAQINEMQKYQLKYIWPADELNVKPKLIYGL